ncbi:hypothetical protein AX15_003444 [Amanita polypyramis BW_CC]|nr:hypothetical protein AX15_003444 [Amanita polypyramis BW_CC]
MTNIRQWFSEACNPDKTRITVSWCPSHKNILENEHVDKLAEEQQSLNQAVIQSTVDSKLVELKKCLYNKWDSEKQKHNGLGHQFLCLKFNNKRIGPSFGKHKCIFLDIVDDNISQLVKVTRFDNEYFHTRQHILCNCTKYNNSFPNL